MTQPTPPPVPVNIVTGEKPLTAASTAAARNYVNSPEWVARMDEWGDGYADMTEEAILSGISNGAGPTATASQMRQYAENIPLSAAASLTRTLQLTSYRDASVEMENINGDFITGKIRIAKLDDRTCLSCVALHGTPLARGQRVDDHYNGRCTEFYQVLGGDEFPSFMQADSTPGNREFVPYQSGEDWFASLSPERQAQQAAMQNSPAMLAAYNDGVPLSAFVGTHEDDVFGTQMIQLSLKDAVANPEDYYLANQTTIGDGSSINARASVEDGGDFRVLPDGGVEWVPASTDVVVTEPAGTITMNAQANQLIDTMPENTQKVVMESGVSEIRVVSADEMAGMVELSSRESSVVGLYLDDTKSILIVGREEGMERTLIHEVAHTLDPIGADGKYAVSESSEWLAASGWKETKNGYELTGQTIYNQAPTAYAQTAPWEDFAESFSQAVNGSDFDRRVMAGESADRYAFIKQFTEDQYGIKLTP